MTMILRGGPSSGGGTGAGAGSTERRGRNAALVACSLGIACVSVGQGDGRHSGFHLFKCDTRSLTMKPIGAPKSSGRLSFDALQRRMVTAPSKARALVKAVPAAFDILAIGGVDLRTQRWTVRRGRLEQLADRWTPPLQISPVTDDVAEGTEWFEVLPEAMRSRA